jgi:hypothetical protein
VSARAILLLLLATPGLAGCAHDPWVYTKRGSTPAALDHDLGACRREAQRPYAFGLTSARRVDQDELKRCMERKGYTVTPDA